MRELRECDVAARDCAGSENAEGQELEILPVLREENRFQGDGSVVERKWQILMML